MQLFFNKKNVYSAIYPVMFSIWYENGATKEFFDYARLLYSSPYLYRYIKPRFWMFILSSFIEHGYIEDVKKLFENYLYFHKDKHLADYFLVAKYAQKQGVVNLEIEKTCFIYDKIQDNSIFEGFKSYLQNKSIAVVGSSGCELKKGKGQEIDAHDIVIRFNNYPENKKYFKDYGQKTTVWQRQTSDKTKHKPDISKYDYVVWGDNKNTLFLNQKHRDIFYNYYKSTPNKIINVNSQYYYELKKISNIYNPTSGAVTLYMLNDILGSLDRVDVYGFAFINQNSNDTTHYFDSACRISRNHYFDKEVIFLNKFYNQNRNKKEGCFVQNSFCAASWRE